MAGELNNSGSIYSQSNAGLKVGVDSPRSVTATQNDFGTVLATGATSVATGVLSTASYMGVPGSQAILSAVGTAQQARSSVTGQGSGLNGVGVGAVSGGGTMGTVTGAYTTGNSAVDGLAAGGDTSAVLLQQTQRMQEMNQSFNLQYLQLQENMQADNRQFTTLSNVMKTKQETAKNAIGNIR